MNVYKVIHHYWDDGLHAGNFLRGSIFVSNFIAIILDIYTLKVFIPTGFKFIKWLFEDNRKRKIAYVPFAMLVFINLLRIIELILSDIVLVQIIKADLTIDRT